MEGFKSMWFLASLAMFVLVAAEECEVDLRGLEVECMIFMHSGNPSAIIDPNNRCCNVIKNADLQCCCRNLDRKLQFTFPPAAIQDLLNWNKVLHCLNFCGRPLPVGTKCGKFTVPPGPPPK